MSRDLPPIPRPAKTGVPALDMLMDPFSYLEQLKKLQEVPPASAPRTTKDKEPPKPVSPTQGPPTTTPPAASTPNVTAPAPAASSTPAGTRDYAAEMDMLRRSYEAERAQMAQASAMGMGPNQLQERQHHERFINRMNQLRALQRQEERRQAYKARARAGAEANAAERLRRQRANEELRAAKISDSIKASQAVNPVDAANQQHLKDLASTNTPPAPTPAGKAPPLPLSVDLATYGEPQAAPTQPVGEPSPTTNYVPGLDGVIRMIRGILQTMPAAQISDLASAPTPAPAAAPAQATLSPNPWDDVPNPWDPNGPAQAFLRDERLIRRNEEEIRDYRRKQMVRQMEENSRVAKEALADNLPVVPRASQGAPSRGVPAPAGPRPDIPYPEDINIAFPIGPMIFDTGVPNIANPMGAPRGPMVGLHASGDPLFDQAVKNVEGRLAPSAEDMQDPRFRRAFERDVRREFARLGGKSKNEIIAPPPVEEMPDRGILGTLIGPGGLFGAPAPDAMIAQLYEIANDPNATPEQRAKAQAGIATAQMQGGLMDLAGAGFVQGKPTSPTTTVPGISRGTPAPLPDEFSSVRPSAATVRRQRTDAAVPIRDPYTTTLTPEEAARMSSDMPYVPEGRFAPQEIPLRGTTTGDIYQPVPRTITTFTPEGVETGYPMPIEPIGSALRGGPGARETRGRDVVSAGDYAQPAGPGNSEGRVEMLRQQDLATDVRLKRDAEFDRILESLIRFGVLPARESSPVAEAPAPAAAPAAKPAQPAPAPKAAEPAPVPATEAPASSPKAKSRQSTIEALKAYGPKVVEDARAFLEARAFVASDPKGRGRGRVTDSDVLTYLKGQDPRKTSTPEDKPAPLRLTLEQKTQMLVNELEAAKIFGSVSGVQRAEAELRMHEAMNNLDSAKRPAPTSNLAPLP